MSETFMGHGRTYQGGRSTAGWRKGPRVTSLDELVTGKLVIGVSHNFKSENLVIVTEQRSQLPGVWAVWANEHGAPSDQNPFSIHGFDLDPAVNQFTEFYLAGRDEVPTQEPERAVPYILVLRMIYDDFQPYGDQSTPSYERAFEYDTLEEASQALALVQNEIDRTDNSTEELLSVCLLTHSLERGDAVEAVREIAGYDIRHHTVEEIREHRHPYWNQFSDTDLTRYIEKGAERA